MPHNVSLIALIAAGLGLAMLFGLIASRLRVPPLVGYLLAGVMIGPGTPGFVADVALAGQLAEIGVMLLMFGVGLHFSLDDLLSVRKIAAPGAVVQIAVATVLVLLGLGAIGLIWKAYLGADRYEKATANEAFGLLGLFALGIFLSTILANILMAQRPRR